MSHTNGAMGRTNGPLPLTLTDNQFRQLLDVVNTETTLSRDVFRRMLDPRRSIEDECGYPRTDQLSPEAYRDQFDRNPIANRVVSVLPRECWQHTPSVYEDEEAEVTTPFEVAWDELGQGLRGEASWYCDEEGHPVWEVMKRADILSRVGHFGVLLLGLDDGGDLMDPVEGAISYQPRKAVKITEGEGSAEQDPALGESEVGGGETLEDDPEQEEPAGNVFCPTGEGGGVDPTCGPNSGRKQPPSNSAEALSRFNATAERVFGSIPNRRGSLHHALGDGRYITADVSTVIRDGRLRFTVRLDFGTSGMDQTDVSDHLQPGSLRLLRTVKEAAIKFHSEGFEIEMVPSDDRRRDLYAKHLTKLGLKKTSDTEYGSVWNVSASSFPQKRGARRKGVRVRLVANGPRRPLVPDSPMSRDEEDRLLNNRGLKTPLNEKELAAVRRWSHERSHPPPPRPTTNLRPTTKATTSDGSTAEESWERAGKSMDSGIQGQDRQYYGAHVGLSEWVNPEASCECRRLLFVRAFSEDLVQVVRYENNINNPRFGLPVIYRITLTDPRQTTQGIGLPTATVFVHWTRVIHLADNLTSSEVAGVPACRPILNRLLDVEKVQAASAEGYWKSGVPGLGIETQSPDVDINVEAAKTAIENFQNSQQKYLLLQGLKATTIAPSVVDPTPFITTAIQAICIQIGVPQRVFMGSERGELASSQDDAAWNDRLRERQQTYITPRMIVPFVDRLILLGVLPEPECGYAVYWPDLDSLGEKDKADVGKVRTETMGAYIEKGVEAMMSPGDFYTKILGFSDEEAQSIIDAACMGQQATMTIPPEGATGHPTSEPPPPPLLPDGTPNPAATEDSLGGAPLPQGQGPGEQVGIPPNGPGDQDDPPLGNVFCPTGEGGGVDPTCGKGDKSPNITKSVAFKNWFGDWEKHPESASKVVNEDGAPMVVHHGTAREFDRFKPDTKNEWSATLGIDTYFFSKDRATAETYANQTETGRVMDVYLNIRNPLIIDANGGEWIDAIGKAQDELRTYRTPEEKAFLELKAEYEAKYRYELEYEPDSIPVAETEKVENAVRKFDEHVMSNRKLYNDAKRKPFKYDGIIVHNVLDMTAAPVDDDTTNYSLYTTVYIAFSPNQIKSSTTKTFDAGDDNVNNTHPFPQKQPLGNYDPRQTRDSRGRWGSGGKNDGKTSPGRSGVSHDKVVEIVDELKQHWAYHGPVHVNDQRGPEFEKGGVKWIEGGNCKFVNGEVTIHSQTAGATENDVRHLVTHEFMHGAYQQVYDRYEADRVKVNTEKVPTRSGLMVKMDGDTLYPGYEDKVPVFAKINPFLGEKLKELIKDDGVTPYSEAYWRDVQDGKCSYHIAIHETLAEIAGLHERTGVIHGSVLWRKFYKEVRFEYVTGRHRTTTTNSFPETSDVDKEHVLYLDSNRRPVEDANDATYLQWWKPDGSVITAVRSNSLQTNYDPSQPRDPGGEGGGQWVKGGAGGSGGASQHPGDAAKGIKGPDVDVSRDPESPPGTRYRKVSRETTHEGVKTKDAKTLTPEQNAEVVRWHDGMTQVNKNGKNSRLPDEAHSADYNDYERGALQKYSYKNDGPLNGKLRGKEDWDALKDANGKPTGEKVPYNDDFYDQMDKNLQSAFDKTPVMENPVTVVRGMNLEGKNLEGFIGKMEASMASGQPMEMGGYTSTAAPGGLLYKMGLDSGIPRPFRGNISLKINAVHGIDMGPHSQLPGEAELLLDKRSRFVVKSIKKGKNGEYQIEVDQLPPPRPTGNMGVDQPRDARGRWTDSGDAGPNDDVEIHDKETGEVFWRGPRKEAEDMVAADEKESGPNPTLGLRRATKSREQAEAEEKIARERADAERAARRIELDRIARLATPIGLRPGHPDYVSPPETMYHATFSGKQIREQGFKSGDEVGQHTLGGTASHTVSFTTKQNAEIYRDGLSTARSAAKGEMTDDQMVSAAVKFGVSEDQAKKLLRDIGPKGHGFEFFQLVSMKGKQFPLFMGGSWPSFLATAPEPEVLAVRSADVMDVYYNPGEKEWRIADYKKLKAV